MISKFISQLFIGGTMMKLDFLGNSNIDVKYYLIENYEILMAKLFTSIGVPFGIRKILRSKLKTFKWANI